ncbi:MAG: FtsW/RodA/SpoVE family cell cycle protein [Candidatus Limivivens sp.]|nr:FtsW/RodA/SpoVE family cell cycle protein [Candidatus Limivivens sp.]
MLRQYKLKDYKFSLVFLVIALSVIGILIIGSAQSSVQNKQILGLVLGLVLMVIVSLIDYTWLISFYWLEYFFGIAILLAVELVGHTAGGATRWIDLGFFQFQPSDVEKIILVLFYAKLFSKYEEKLSTFKMILFFLITLGIPVFLIYRQPNLSTSILILLLFCAMIFAAGLSYKIIGGIIAVCVPVAVIFFGTMLQQGQSFFLAYQMQRILAWLHPEDYPDLARQQQNSIIAIGSGQLYGKGLDNNAVSSVKNGNFIAEAQTDFIFAVAGEELGFLGCCIIIILELLVALECVRIGQNARELSGTLIGCGMGALIFIQCFINICVATGLMPNTGLPLPFVSYGLTSLVSFFIGIGIVLNVGLQVRKY